MREILNCPNCGAPITSEQCPYCGTLFYDFSAIEIGKPCFLKIKWGNNIMLVKADVRNIDLNMSSDTVDTYDICGGRICSFVTRSSMDMTMEFNCIPFNDHLLELRSVEN